MIDAVGSFLLTYTLHSAALGAAALLSGALLRGQAVLRCAVWKVALAAPLLTSAITLARPGNDTVSFSSMASRVVQVAPPTVDVDVREIRGGRRSRVERVRDPVGTSAAILFISFGLLGLARGSAFLMRRRRFLMRVSRAAAEDRVCHPSLGRIPAVETDLVAVPVALAHGLIALPRSFMTIGSEQSRSAILLHERAHIERRDPAWADLARFLAESTPWQPINRLIGERLERDVELAADAHAISLGADAVGLVEGLAIFAARVLSPTPAGASLIRSESPLVQRAREALYGTRRTPRLTTRLTISGLFILLGSAMAALPSFSARNTAMPASPGRGVEIMEIDIREQPRR